VQELDLMVRVGAGAALLLVATLLLRVRASTLIPWLFVLLALGLCGFLARNTGYPDLTLSGFPAMLAAALSGCAAVFIWWFCLAVFDDDFRMGPLALGIGGAWFVIAMTDRGWLFSAPPDIELSWLLVVIGVAMVGHLAWHLLRDREGDLVESRRRARWRLVATLATLLLVDLGVDLAMGLMWRPPWFTLAQNSVILAFAVSMAHWLLRADVDALSFRSASLPVAPSRVLESSLPGPPPSHSSQGPRVGTSSMAAPAIVEPDTRLLDRLRNLMDAERVYRDPELTFAAFVARMGAPEPAVRRLVNQALGHRHFRSFLNTYRVADARVALADPMRANDKMVAIAFDAGFASLASFNRAFKEIEGRPPSDFRTDAATRS
jgi:AraC-like DNA-binding protein